MPIHPEVMALTRRVHSLEKQARRRKQPGLAYSSIEDGALQSMQDGTVRMIIGTQYDGTQGAVSVNGPPPPKPSVPGVTERDAGLAVYWDGTFADPAEVAPMDFVRVTVHATPLSEFTTLNPLDQTRIFGSITEATGGERFASLPPGVEHIVHLVCWSASGKFSEPSDGITGVPHDLGAAVQADLDAVNASIAAGDSANSQAIDAAIDDYTAKYGAVDTRVTNAIADYTAKIAQKSKHTLASTAPTTADAGNSGDVWERFESTSGSQRIIGRWRLMNSSSPYNWQPMALDATYIPQLDIGNGTFGTLDGARLQVGTVQAEKLTVASFGGVLVGNGGFEDPGVWGLQNGAARVNTAPRSGSYHLRLGASGGWQVFSPTFPVAAGEILSLTAYAKAVAGPTGLYLRVSWRDAAGAELGIYDVAPNVNVASSYTQYGGKTGLAPAGTAGAFVQVYNTTGSVDIDDIDCRKVLLGAQIADGVITAQHVATQSLTTKQIIIGDTVNLFADLSSNQERANYVPTAGWAYDIFPGNSEGDRYRVKFTGGGALAYNEFFFGPQTIVEPGDQIYISCDVYREAATNYGIHVGFNVYESNGTTVTSYDLGNSASVGGIPADTWTPFSGPVTVPANGRLILPRFKVSSNAGSSLGSWYVRNVKARRMSTGSLIVDGAIQAKHITADMVSGLLLSGRVIQTDPAANRGIKISNSGLVGYNSSGVVTTVIDPVSGRITAAGSFNTAIGSNDIEIRPGDGLSVTAAMRFINASGSRYRNTDPATLSLQTMGSSNGWLLTLQGAMSTESTNRPRIDITTDNTTSGTTTTYISHSASLYHRFDINTSNIARIENTGVITTTGNGFFDQTYLNSGGAAAIINNNGRFTKSGSLRRLKRNVEDMTLEQAQSLYELRPTTGQWIEDLEMGDAYWPFFIAEEVAATSGGDIWAAYNGDGEVTGVHYAEITVGLVALVRDLNERLHALESAA